jgi:DNA-directed RNA polymerase subunit L
LLGAEAESMELNLISKDKKAVVIEFTDVKETLVHPLIDKLLSDKDVIFAAYKTGHPQLDRPKLTVRTQRVKPETAVKNAADSLSDEVVLLKKEFEKAVKRGTRDKKAKPKRAKKVSAKTAVPRKKSKAEDKKPKSKTIKKK